MVRPFSSAARAPGEAEAEDRETDGVVEAVAEKIERVGVEADGAGDDARHDLGREHDGIDGERRPQDRPARRWRIAVFAAMRAHGRNLAQSRKRVNNANARH